MIRIAMLYQTLLAETHLHDVNLEYREEVVSGGFSGAWFVLISLIVIVLAGVLYKLHDRPPGIVNTPMGMFHELCHAHRIKGKYRHLLEQIAENADLEQPATMFLGPAQFEAAVKKAGVKNPDPKHAVTLAVLRRRLFS